MALSRLLPASFEQPNPVNFIINSEMAIAQRSVTAVTAATNYPSVDRFKAWEDTDGAFTVEQSTTAPVGFAYSFKAQVTTADGTMGAAQYSSLSQQIEGQNLQSLLYGTSSAKTITLSFHVRSSKTGSYSITFYKGARSGTSSYLFSKSYTIDSANTWEKKTITITPDSQIKASAGAIANDNGIGIYLFWNLSGGTNQDDATDNAWSSNTSHYHTSSQVNWMDSTSNDFYLTGVQLEIGEKATDFEYINDFGKELAQCQRYFCRTYTYGVATGTATVLGAVVTQAEASTVYSGSGTWRYPVEMRAAPTIIAYSTQNANTTGKTTADGTDGTATIYGIGAQSAFICRHNDSSGVVANAFLKVHATAYAEL